MSKRIRLDIDLEDEEMVGLDALADYSHRSRKNMVEALLKISIRTFNNGNFFIQLNNLGPVNEPPKKPGEKD